MMIRPARDADLDPIARIYDEILDLEDARPVSYTNWQRAGIPPGTPPVRRWTRAPSGSWRRRARSAAVSTSMGSSSRNTARSLVHPRRPGGGRGHPHPGHPSQPVRPGLARRLVDFCEEELRRQGKRAVRLDTYIHNVPANAMYPRLGYRFAGSGDFLFQDFLPRYSTAMKSPVIPPFPPDETNRRPAVTGCGPSVLYLSSALLLCHSGAVLPQEGHDLAAGAGASGLKAFAPVPAVMFSDTAQRTASA